MLRRCTTSLALLTASLNLAGNPAPAHASGVVSNTSGVVSEMMVNGVDAIVPAGTAGSTMYAYYQVTNPRTTAAAAGLDDLVVSTVVPPNAIQPINATTSPLSIVNGSFGFDPSNLQVFLSPPGASTQQIALLFGNGGLAPGGALDFKVSLDKGYSSMTAPTLTLQAPFADLSTTAPGLMAYTPSSANASPTAAVTSSGSSPSVSTPEPASMALWSALAVAGLIRAGAFRHARAGRPIPPAA